MGSKLPALAFLYVSVARLGNAEAEPLPLSLAWDAPEGCPDAAFVTHRVEQILRGPPVGTTIVVATAKVVHTEEARFELALTVRTDGVEETRTMVASTCTALAHASAVVVALAIDPSSDVPPGDDEPSVEEPPRAIAVAPARVEARAPPASPPRASPSPPPFAVGAGTFLTSGILPNPSAGLVLSGAVRRGRFRAGLLGAVSLRQNPMFDKTAGASFDVIEVGAFGGYLVPLGVVAVGPCANVEATYVHVQGFGIRSPGASSVLWPKAVFGARMEARLTSWLALVARADVLVSIAAPTFTLATGSNAVRLHEPNLVAPRLSLGVEMPLP